MPTQIADLFLLEDLGDLGRTSKLAERDRAALQAVADWIETYVVRPHKDIGRDGPVCPFVPGALERNTLWLAPEQIGDRGVPELVTLMDGYKRLFLDTAPADGDAASYKVIVVVFTDLAAERAQGVFDAVLEQLALPSYVDHGVIFGPFYEGNEGTALYNASFRPFQSPVPFLFMRNTVVSDWKFFIDDDNWLGLWARRFGESGAHALAEELRRSPWRVGAAGDRETSSPRSS
jgi:hypothetical protein